jgi:hypothetical protein
MPWMSLYFSVAVWSSLALCIIGLVRDRLLQHCTSPANQMLAAGPVAGRRLGQRPQFNN